MKRLLVLLVVLLALFSVTGFAQLPQILRDNFNGYSVGADLNGQLKWKKLKSTGTDTVGTMVTDNSGRIITSSFQGVNHWGGLLWDSAFANNGTDECVFGITAPVKGSLPNYQNPGNQDIMIFCMMDSAGSPTTGYLDKWSGNVVILGSWNNNSGGFSMRFANVNGGVIGAEYGGSTAGNEATPSASSPSASDTIWVKVKGNVINLYRTNPNAGSGLMYSQTMTQTVKSTGKFAVLVRQSATPTTAFNDAFIGLTVPPIFVPPTIDTIPPAVLAAGPSVANPDTTGFYFTLHVVDNNTSTQLNPKIKWQSIRRDSLGGSFKDSTHIDFAAGSQPTDYTLNTSVVHMPAGNYLLTYTAVDSSGNVVRVQKITQVGTARTLWCTAYYNVWLMNPGSMNPDLINYQSGVTVLIQFNQTDNVRPTAPAPWFGPIGGVFAKDSTDVYGGTGGGPNYPPYRDSLVARAHRNNIRVLVCLQAVNPTGLLDVIDANRSGTIDGLDSARCDTLTAGIAAYLNRNKYDGIDVNIENSGPVSKAITSLLIRRLRHFIDLYSAGIGGKMIITLSPTSGDNGKYDAATCNLYVDQINPQTYDNQYAHNACPGVNTNAGWYSGNVYPPSDTQLGSYASCFGVRKTNSIAQHGPNLWVADGFQKRILGVGVSSYGRFRNDCTGPFTGWSAEGYTKTTQAQINNILANCLTGGLQPYDATTKSQSIIGTARNAASYLDNTNIAAGQAFYYTYPTPRVIQDQVQYIKDSSYSGIMIYDMAQDPNQEILNAAGQATGGFQLPLPPAAPTNSTPADGAINQPLTGILFSWSASTGATLYHYQTATDIGFSNIVYQFDNATNQVTSGLSSFGALLPNTTYYWRVNATGVSGTSAYSTSTSFSTISQVSAAPHVPVLVSPINNVTLASISVILSVGANTGFTDTISTWIYQVRPTDTTTSTFVVDDSSTNSSTRQFTATAGLTYFWRAAAKNGAGRSPNTVYGKFNVQANAPNAVATQSDLRFDPSTRTWTEGVNIPGHIEKIVPTNQWSNLGLRSNQIKVYYNGYIDSLGNTTLFGSGNIQTQPITVSALWTFSAGINTNTITTGSLGITGNLLTDLVPMVNTNYLGIKFNGTLANPWQSMNTNILSLVNANSSNPNSGASLVVPSTMNGVKTFYFRPRTGITNGLPTTDTVATIADLAALPSQVILDSTIRTHIHIVDEFMHNTDGVANMASGAVGSSANLQGDLGWTPYALVNATRARNFTVGMQYVNTSVYSKGMGWVFLTAPDSSDGTTPTGGWLTFARSGPVKHTRPTKAIMYFHFTAPKFDSSLVVMGFSAKVQGAEDSHLSLTESSVLEIGSAVSATETVYVVSSNGTTKTKTFMKTVTAGAAYDGVLVYNTSSIDYYIVAEGTALGSPTTVSTNLGAGTNGLTPIFGAWEYKRTNYTTSVAGGVNTTPITAIDAWQYDEYLTR